MKVRHIDLQAEALEYPDNQLFVSPSAGGKPGLGIGFHTPRDRDSSSCVRHLVGFEATNIFPLAYERQWAENNYSRSITIDP
ncbi:hypothetical protein N657DRAFT_645618 [Parathielavia appendiculata]|uniref:Uncharacterized protein n=1 Tax=Parathielavia appendiculata TaxID=2587402 RepID=A0AAN6U0A9_9PEZI|nr:hypothetical protein N657DRAFT_645618 [Parathielavia appendiculata]